MKTILSLAYLVVNLHESLWPGVIGKYNANLGVSTTHFVVDVLFTQKISL